MSTYCILASYWLGGTHYTQRLNVPAVGPDHARLIVTNAILGLFRGAMHVTAELIA